MRTYLISATAAAVWTGLALTGASAAPTASLGGLSQAGTPATSVAMSRHDRMMMMKRKRMMMMKKKKMMMMNKGM